MDAYNFMVQQRTFAVHGYALNPSTSASSSQAVVGSTDVAHENGYSGIDTMRPSKSVRREQKRKRGEKGDAGVVDGEGAYMGPWAAYESERVAEVIEVDPEAEEEWQVEKKRRDEAKEAAQEKMKEAKVEKSIFHGQSLLVLSMTGADRDRKGSYGLCWTDVYAHSDRFGCQAQSLRWSTTTKRLCSRTMCSHLGASTAASHRLG
jgi:hypothetical protein